MSSKWSEELVVLQQQAAKIQKQIGLMEELVKLEGGTVAVAAPAKPKAAPKPVGDGTGKKRGRPRKEVSADAAAQPAEEKSLKLPALLRALGPTINKAATIAELVNMVKEAGYKSDAKDYHNMVYQGIQKLVTTGEYRKTVAPNDPESRAYEWTNVPPASDAAGRD